MKKPQREKIVQCQRMTGDLFGRQQFPIYQLQQDQFYWSIIFSWLFKFISNFSVLFPFSGVVFFLIYQTCQAFFMSVLRWLHYFTSFSGLVFLPQFHFCWITGVVNFLIHFHFRILWLFINSVGRFQKSNCYHDQSNTMATSIQTL